MSNTHDKEIKLIIELINRSDSTLDLQKFETDINNLFKADKYALYTKFEERVVQDIFKEKYEQLNK